MGPTISQLTVFPYARFLQPEQPAFHVPEYLDSVGKEARIRCIPPTPTHGVLAGLCRPFSHYEGSASPAPLPQIIPVPVYYPDVVKILGKVVFRKVAVRTAAREALTFSRPCDD